MARHVILYVAFSLTCTGVLVTGCSGAETQDVLLGASGSSSSGSSSGTSSNTSGGGTSPGTSGGPGSGDPGTCAREQEPNDDEDEANTLAPALCGTLSGRDDRDYLTFRLLPETKSLKINFTGRVRLRVDVDGHDTAELTPDEAGDVPFVTGADYFIEVRPLDKGNAAVDWRVEIIQT